MNQEDIKRISQSIDTTLRIGKKGLSETIFKEIEKQIKKRGLIKVKCLNNFLKMNDLKSEQVAEEIARITKLSYMRKGNAIIFFKPNNGFRPKFKR